MYKHLGGGHRGLDVTLHVDETNALVESVMKAHPGERLHNRTVSAGKRQLAESAPVVESNATMGSFDSAFADAAGDLANKNLIKDVKNAETYGENMGRNAAHEIYKGLDQNDDDAWERAHAFLRGFASGVAKAAKE